MAKGNGSGQRWICTKCGCKRNLAHWWRCKHCRSPYSEFCEWSGRNGDEGGDVWWQDWQDGIAPGTAARATESTEAAPPLPARPGPQRLAPGAVVPASASPEAKVEDIQAIIDSLTRIGDANGAASYSKLLEVRKAQQAAATIGPPLQHRVNAAFQSVRALEGKLERAVGHYQRLETQLAEQRNWVHKLNSDLEAAEAEHTQLVRALHANTCGPGEPRASPATPVPSVVTISIDDILEGKSDLPISLGTFGQLDGDEYELDQTTKDEAKKRMDTLQADIKAAVGTLFGAAAEKIKAAKEEHQKLIGRLQKKRRAHDSSALPGGQAAAAPAQAADAPAEPSAASEPAGGGGGAPPGGEHSATATSEEEIARRATRQAAANILQQSPGDSPPAGGSSAA
eukprot:2521728-Pyramimonas_sp.AAC.2